jgi:imidazole glycerol phosphate synthase glutamine amidotransferase subunit
MPDAAPVRVAFAATGVANLASIMAAFRRAGAEPYLSPGPEDLAAAAFAVVPGVGAFGSAMSALRAAGMDEAIKDRITRRAPTAGVCAGMQVFFEASEESPGVEGLCLVPGRLGRFPSSLPVPQLGWNRITPPSPEEKSLNDAERSSARDEGPKDTKTLVREGWAYFANSYRLTEAPAGLAASRAEYGESFVAAAEGEGLLLCQFHPELSGPWGRELLERWLAAGAALADGAPEAREGRTS